MITREYMSDQLIDLLGEEWDQYPIDAIVTDLIKYHGLADLDTIPYWDTVAKHHPMRRSAEF